MKPPVLPSNTGGSAGGLVDQRQHHELGAALLEFAIQNPSVSIVHSKILLCRSRQRQSREQVDQVTAALRAFIERAAFS
jgi:hypothetical protein